MPATANAASPDGRYDCVCLTVDIDWASDEVLQDLRRRFDALDLRATFFCTHAGIDVGPHERALHPNFRRHGDTMRALAHAAGPAFADWGEPAVYRGVIQTTRAFCPEAVGVRAHSLFYDSLLLEAYQEAGLVYDSTYLLPFAPRLAPVPKEYGILELPLYYNDHFDLKAQATDFQVDRLRLDEPGLKILNFHPNLVWLNAATNEQYLASRPFHKDPDRLREMRHPGRGIGTLLEDVLEQIAARRLRTATLREIHDQWRAECER